MDFRIWSNFNVISYSHKDTIGIQWGFLTEREGEQWAVYYSSPQIFLFVGLTTLGILTNFWLVGLFSWVLIRLNH